MPVLQAFKTLLKINTFGLAVIISTIGMMAIAQKASTQTSPELDRLQYFEGTWRCQQPAAPASPSGIFIWTVKRDLNDFWYLGNAEETQSPKGGEPINSREFLGYDIADKKLVRFVVVGNGNSFNMTGSDWQDNKLVWSGTVIDREKGQSIPLRQEIIRDSSDRFTATYFVPDDEGNWQPIVDETCAR